MTNTKPPAGKTNNSAALAEAYLDFWQRNIMAWSVDPSLYHEWARRLVAERWGTLGDEE